MPHILNIINTIGDKLGKDRITGYAAESCFYITLSFVPFLLVLMSLIQYLPLTADSMAAMIQEMAPVQLKPILETLIRDVYSNSSLTLTSVTMIGTLWAAGKGFLAIIDGMNAIYDAPATRNWLIQRLMSTVYTLAFLAALIATLTLLVFGNQLVRFTANVFPSISLVLNAIISNNAILFPCILVILFLAIYRFIPNRKSTIAREFPGAALAAVGWCLFSYFYSLYVDYSPNFSYMYGSLTTLVFALIWMYTCMTILFLGAEFNKMLSDRFLSSLLFPKKASRNDKAE